MTYEDLKGLSHFIGGDFNLRGKEAFEKKTRGLPRKWD